MSQNNDLISRQAAIDKAIMIPVARIVTEDKVLWRKAVFVEDIEKLPSAQPVAKDINVPDKDPISRQGVLRLLNAVPSEEFATKAMLISGVKALPSAQPEDRCSECDAWNQYKNYPSAQSGWIPWDSGMFPEESGTYTVTAYDGATKRVTYAKYQKRLKRWELTGARAYWRVLAWMEKPKPWEGVQE